MSRRIGYLVGIATLVGSGVLLFLSLFRWEWNRTLIAGMFFIAAEIGVLAAVIIERLKKIESKIADGTNRDVIEVLEENPSPPKDRFAWLSDGDNLGVFIPFLLGAGLVVSAVAWLVERVAHATATPVLDRRLAARLAPVVLPRAGLMGTPQRPVEAPHFSPVVLAKQIAVVVLAVVALWLAIDVIADATQTRSDKLVPGSYSVVTIELTTNGSVHGIDAAQAMWLTCWGTVPSDLSDPITHAGGNRYLLRLEPALGPNSERRLRGCLSDATLDNYKGRVVSVTNRGN